MSPMTPSDFTARFPRYVYRSQKGQVQVQWRAAALDMTEKVDALKEALHEVTESLAVIAQHATSEEFFTLTAQIERARAALAR